MNQRTNLISLAHMYCEHRSQLKPLSMARLSTLIFNHGARLTNISGGANFTVDSYQKALQWFSDHWPSDLAWPAEIERPAPNPDSPSAMTKRAALETAKHHPAIQLSVKGQIENPADLCELLDIELSNYYQATSQYAEGKPRGHRMPRSGSELNVLVSALALVGDRRFINRKSAIQMSMAMPGKTELRNRLSVLPEVA